MHRIPSRPSRAGGAASEQRAALGDVETAYATAIVGEQGELADQEREVGKDVDKQRHRLAERRAALRAEREKVWVPGP